MFSRPAVLSVSHRLEHFDSGKPSLDVLLKSATIESQRLGHSRTFVIADDDLNVAGYHVLCGGMLGQENAPRPIGGHGASREIPVALLARLAVDRNHKGRQLGTILLRHAFGSVLAASEFVGFRAIMAHALDGEAVSFYAKFGFRAARGLERTLLISLEDVAGIMAQSRKTG